MAFIDVYTDRHPRGANASPLLQQHWSAAGRIILHHNHMSGESLSHLDWQALCTKPMDEIVAHAPDGSVFLGKPVDPVGTLTALTNWHNATIAADNAMMALMGRAPNAATLAGKLSKHVLALALAENGHVTYEQEFGPSWSALAGVYGAVIAAGAGAAAPLL